MRFVAKAYVQLKDAAFLKGNEIVWPKYKNICKFHSNSFESLPKLTTILTDLMLHLTYIITIDL